MEINRNQYFMAGLVLLFLGIEFRLIDSLVLTPECTKFLAERTNHPAVAASNTLDALVGTEAKFPAKTVQLPEYVGWGLTSLGAVLVLHALAMPKPAG